MSLSKLTNLKGVLIESCMKNDLSAFKPILNSPQVIIDGNDKAKFFSFFEKTLQEAHKKSKGDWSLGIENADWIKDKSAEVYDFYDGKNKQPRISVVLEESENGVWIEVLRG